DATGIVKELIEMKLVKEDEIRQYFSEYPEDTYKVIAHISALDENSVSVAYRTQFPQGYRPTDFFEPVQIQRSVDFFVYLMGGTKPPTALLRLMNSMGEIVTCQRGLSCERDSEGRATRVVMAMTDITEQLK